MEKAEYWIITSVVEALYPLNLLLAENLEEIYNRSGHGLNRTMLVKTLDNLFRRGDLIATLISHFEPTVTFVPTLSEIESALDCKYGFYFGLTAQGGARWEALSKPDWNRYLHAAYGYDPNEGEMISQNFSLVEQQLVMEQYLGHLVVPDSVRRDILMPWQATYWKTLPIGYRTRFLYLSQEEIPEEPQEYEHYVKGQEKAMTWIEQIDQWYHNYFEVR